MPLPKEPEEKFEFDMPEDEDSNAASQQEAQSKEEEIEIIDDTPDEDKDPRTGKMREPLPQEIVQELEEEELEEYSEKVKTRLKQMKKVWHDERRAKEAAMREQQEAITFAQRIIEENRKLKSSLSEGEKTLVGTFKQAAELEMEMAKRAYKEAYDSGDSDQLLEAQQKLSDANYKLQQVANYRPPLQAAESSVNMQPEREQQAPRPQLEAKTKAWQERNSWYGTDPEMTALALGFHQKLEREMGPSFVGTDDYWQRVDQTMRRRFPEYFGEEVQTLNGGGKPVRRTDTKPATVVAPASRSTSSKRIVLTQRQVSLAKKFGLTPEQYARELKRLENTNG
jgi:hypothetical protein